MIIVVHREELCLIDGAGCTWWGFVDERWEVGTAKEGGVSLEGTYAGQ